MSAFLAAAQLMDLVNYITAFVSMDVGLYLLRAQSGHAAAQRGKLGLRSVSSHFRNADVSTVSEAWPDNRTFGGWKQLLDEQ